MIPINYNLLYDGDIFSTDLNELIATNRNLPPDWCTRLFTEHPSLDFLGLESASKIFLYHLKLAEIHENDAFKQKIQIVVDSDLDGICSATILYKFLHEFYPDIETVYSIHTGKQHGLSKDIKIDKDTTLVILPDAGSNDIYQCHDLKDKFVDVICLDHHIIEQPNPYASIVNCMDGIYPNQDLCGAAVTWLFLYGFCQNCIEFFDEHHSFLLELLDLVAIATVSDIMDVTNEDNMFFIQNGLNNIRNNALKTFLTVNEVNLNDVTIEDIKFKVSPLISAMMRMGNIEEKTLLFRAFIDDYEEFDYEKRGSIGIEVENIYDRAVRLCKNAKGRQDRAKQKLLDECYIYEYPHIVLVEYQSDKASTLTGLVANELANKYCKPCFVYRTNVERDENGEAWFSGSVRNYDGSPVASIKDILTNAFQKDGEFIGHAGACGGYVLSPTPNDNAGFLAEIIEGYIQDNSIFTNNTKGVIGEKVYDVDFEIHSDVLDAGFIRRIHHFDDYSGFGFAPVTALVSGIKVAQENFMTMGKNTFNFKILDENNNVSYVKFKVDKETDELVNKFDDIDFGFTNYSDKVFVIDAICTFGLNIYKGEIHPQAIIKDYVISEEYEGKYIDDDSDDLDLDLEF